MTMPPAPAARAELSRGAGGVGLVLGAALLFSSGGLFIKLAPLPAPAVACVRSAVAGLFLLAVLRPRLRAARLGTALAYAAMLIGFVTATKLTTAANAVFLQFTGPIYVLGLAPWLLRERFRPADAGFVLVALAGMALILGAVDPGGARAGNLFGVASGVAYAFAIVLLRRDALAGACPGGAGDPALAAAALGNLIAAAATLPWAWSHLPAALAPGALLALLYLGVVQIGVAYVLFTRGLRTVPAAAAALLTMLEPVLNPLWVYLGTGERPGPAAVGGGALILGAVALRTGLAMGWGRGRAAS